MQTKTLSFDDLKEFVERGQWLPQAGKPEVMTVAALFFNPDETTSQAYIPITHQGCIEAWTPVEFDIAASVMSDEYIMWRGATRKKRVAIAGDQYLLVYPNKNA